MILMTLWACNGVKIEGPVDTGTVPSTGDTAPEDTDLPTDTDLSTDSGDSADGGDSGDSADSGSGEPGICDTLPEGPLDYDVSTGWSGAEDFTFDGEGYLISVDNGSLTRRNRDGDEIIVRPGLGETAGIHMLANGREAVYANVSGGSVIRIDIETGGYDNILGGLSYPNGIEVGADGYVYVAEHSGGRIHRVHPETGDSEVLATGMVNPNGIAFGPDEETLYWGSFGNGSVYAVDREGDGFGEAYLFGYSPDSSTYWSQLSDPCGGLGAGDNCYASSGGIGSCEAVGENLFCSPVDGSAPCDGLEVGDVCTQTLFGVEVTSACVESGPPIEPVVVCATVSADALAPCDGLTELAACEGDAGEGLCLASWEGLLVCASFDAETEATITSCDGLDEHTACSVGSDVEPFSGVCQLKTSFEDGSQMVCTQKPNNYGSHGGLDGLNVDACGNVYVTEYVYGYVWKFSPEGGTPTFSVDLPSSWIPNMHWGNGVGGWERDVLYVMDRNYGGWGGGGSDLFELAVEIEGVTQAFEP